MNVLVAVHPNIALTDNWTNDPAQGMSYYADMLDARANYDFILCSFLHPRIPAWTIEHDKFVSRVRRSFDVVDFEFKVGELMLRCFDKVLFRYNVQCIDFAGGYATDCLAETLRLFLAHYATYCERASISVRLRFDLIYDSWSRSRLSQPNTEASLEEMLHLSCAVQHKTPLIYLNKASAA